ncbi:MAG: nucleoside deaminase [bacterium]|nr:nucleoside deaminase [bacterium]MDD5353958.1 nucleoside deaminase [bacterium]MDD5756217.1 nucleoside deaminase [bacterium]
MMLAILEARKNLKNMLGGPFGACIVKRGRVIAVARNTVLNHDSTCHAEINAIRQAAKKLRTFDLSGCEIYSTTEPCPMCFAAIHWAKITKIYYGTRISDVRKRGFNELVISNSLLKKLGRSTVIIIRDCARKECLDLLKDWDRLPAKQVY